ncbi:hypothetical protein C9374_014543 [Naegleria lovaniensis]|uniref:Uncharacterized protein n=1 Tax=Naegleria lovaniensis TaxID=51637 RepID=A0AA88H142_NAELO|nr:uncharacterized protein C9374_014543 [Naegleria lovaniensis]KAG2389143.1 hypothetical protein C9374_014543 [Naegleria lovaniensis]
MRPHLHQHNLPPPVPPRPMTTTTTSGSSQLQQQPPKVVVQPLPLAPISTNMRSTSTITNFSSTAGGNISPHSPTPTPNNNHGDQNHHQVPPQHPTSPLSPKVATTTTSLKPTTASNTSYHHQHSHSHHQNSTIINQNNNSTLFTHYVQEETINVPLSQEQIAVYQKQLSDVINKLKQTHTDGKEKAKALEHVIYLSCTLKSDFTMTLFLAFPTPRNSVTIAFGKHFIF